MNDGQVVIGIDAHKRTHTMVAVETARAVRAVPPSGVISRNDPQRVIAIIDAGYEASKAGVAEAASGGFAVAATSAIEPSER